MQTTRQSTSCHRRDRRQGGVPQIMLMPRNVDGEKIGVQLPEGLATMTLPRSLASVSAGRTFPVKSA